MPAAGSKKIGTRGDSGRDDLIVVDIVGHHPRYGERRDRDSLSVFCRELGHFPTKREMMLHRKSNPTFPVHDTHAAHFPTKAELVTALRAFATTNGHPDLLRILPGDVKPREQPPAAVSEGSVYLVKSGDHYRIG
jgi:hypothetical protein